MYEKVVGQKGMGSLSVIWYVDAVLLGGLSPSEDGGEFEGLCENTSGFSSIIRLWLRSAVRALLRVMGAGSGVVVVVVKVELRSGGWDWSVWCYLSESVPASWRLTSSHYCGQGFSCGSHLRMVDLKHRGEYARLF